MSEYYNIVPWHNSREWLTAYDKIYSPTSTYVNKQEAHNLLLIWKARCPFLPSGVESTLTLLDVYIQDVNNSDHIVNEQLLRLAYSSAVMRFVNHMLDTETAKGTSLYQAAKNMGVPDWIVDMRHDTAHSNNLPSIELLREACLISLEWLRKHYWKKYQQYITDYTSGQKDTDKNEANKIAAFMNFCISLSVCAHSQCKIKNLSEIPDPSMRESIVNDARDLFGDQIDLSNLKTVSVMALINLMNLQAKKWFKAKDITTLVNKALVGEDTLFLSLDLLNFMGGNDFYYKNKLNRHYVQCFEVLLTFLHTNDLLLDFILELIKLTQSCDTKNDKCLLAALWISEILKALRKSKQFFDKMNKNNPSDMSSKKKKELKALFHHWFPGENVYGLLLDLHKPVPREVMNIHFVQPIIAAYNPYLTYFIKDLLNLVEPHLPKNAAEKICKLAKLIASPETLPTISSKIYTVNDLKMAEDVTLLSEDSDNEKDSDCDKLHSNVNPDVGHRQPSSSVWHLASSEHCWAACPIGELPWQQKGDSQQKTD